jgi:hypothetical protein
MKKINNMKSQLKFKLKEKKIVYNVRNGTMIKKIIRKKEKIKKTQKVMTIMINKNDKTPSNT